MPASIRVAMFGGIIPRLADRGLPDNAAQFALNAKLYSGELRSWNNLLPKGTSAYTETRKVFHYRHTGLDRYMTFPTDADVVKAPLLNEQLGRLYWTTPISGPKINTTARIETSSPAFDLGIPPPTNQLGVTATGGTAANATTRAYTAIYVSAYGEEGMAVKPTLASGNTDGTWTITGLDQAPPANRNITKIRLYRTITTFSGVDYRMVNEWPVNGPSPYVDNVPDTTVATNPVLQSLTWAAPPTNLQGLIGVAGGYMAGFVGRTVYLSVPYQPHAWPDDQQYGVEDDIVGLGTFGNTIVITTQGRPYLLVGPQPDAMALQKMESIQPCLSKRSIVNTVSGCMYASTDGIVLVDGNSLIGQIISRQWVTKDEWLSRFSPATIQASIYQDRYFAFYTDSLGFTVGFDDPVTGWTELQQADVESVDLDVLTGQTLVTITNPAGGNDIINEWDGDPTGQLAYVWETKPFTQNKPVNFGAIQIRGNFVTNASLIPIPPALGTTGMGGDSAFNGSAINGAPRTTLAPVDGVVYYGGSINGPATWQMLGVSQVIGSGIDPSAGIAIKVYGDKELRWFGNIADEKPYRLPSGYKATLWEVEVQGSSALFSVTLADTIKTLENLP